MVNENGYSAAQIAVWKKANTPKAIRESLKRRTIFCAFTKGKLIGTIGLEEQEVVGLYVSYSKRGLGIGGILLQHLEEYARQQSIVQLSLTATPSAQPFYAAKGYTRIKQVAVNIQGVDFHETAMFKELNHHDS